MNPFPANPQKETYDKYNKGASFNNTGFQRNNQPQSHEISIASNYFRFKHINPNKQSYFKYSVDFNPELPDDSKTLRKSIWRAGFELIKLKLGKTIFNNTAVYSKENNPEDIEITTNYKDQDYVIIIKWACLIENESFESLAVYKRYFNSLMRNLKFIDMRRSYFNPKSAVVIKDFNLDVWAGFSPTVSQLKSGILLNLNVTHKIIRYETALEEIHKMQNNISDKSRLDEELRSFFKGCCVVTRYNGEKTFTIENISLDLNPETKFNTAKGPISYTEYYLTKYNKKINSNQPLLKVIDSRTKNEIYLIPELCYLTGLSDQMRTNFNLMKDIAAKTKGNPLEKYNETRGVINQILSHPGCQKEIEEWGITLENDVIRLKGNKIPTGNVLMSKQQDGCRLRIDIDRTPDLDRKIQNEMFSQPNLNNWIFVYQARENQAAESFLNTLQEVLKTFNYASGAPVKIEVKSNRFEDWRNFLLNKLTPQTQMVVCLISGNRGNGPLYKPLKNFLLTERPVPSQILLSGTINKPKGLRSVVNKVLIQMCAKLGGEPWAMDQLPFTSEPTMICAIETFEKKSIKNPIMAFCATYNDIFTKYISLVKETPELKDVPNLLGDCLKESLSSFHSTNKIYPKHIIIFRDGLPQSRFGSIITADVEIMKNAIKSLDPELNIKITYLTLNKKTNVKLFFENHNDFSNCPPGTVIESSITSEAYKDFYLISQKTTQGVSQPTHFYIAYDDKGVNDKDIHTLVYKLSYLYYNWTGAIRIPAPCQNVKKLVRLIAEKCSDRSFTTIPADRFHKTIKSLYYL